jgi:hypothetical protein
MDPDCRDGKHRNCDGMAWSNELDRPAPCSCRCHNRVASVEETMAVARVLAVRHAELLRRLA